MNIKKLDKAHKVLSEIKALDAEIIEIEKHAMLIANGDVELSLTIGIKDLNKKKQEDPETTDPYDHISSYLSGSVLRFGMCGGSIKPKEESIEKYKTPIQENEALQILGVLLYVRQNKRTLLLKNLEAIGVSV